MRKILKTIKKKWPEYVLEIIVIVFSIFGGLELENWNERRKENGKETFYKKALIREFEANFEELKGDIEGRKKILQNINTIKQGESLNQNPSINGGHVINEGRVLDAVRFFVPSSATYDDLIVTGQIDVLKSDSLRYWLMTYNQELKRNDKVEQIDFQFVQSVVVPFIVTNENYLKDNSIHYEFAALCDRRLSNNETILHYNETLLTVIENVIKHLRMK